MRNLPGRPGTRTEGRYEENLSLRDTPSGGDSSAPSSDDFPTEAHTQGEVENVVRKLRTTFTNNVPLF